MKLHLFIWLIAVLGFVRGHGAPAGAMTLQPERLEAVVAQLEAVYENAGQQLPTLVYSAGVRDLSVEAPLRLGEVRAVDALTLIAAAAGCELEPIHSLEPEEESEGIIG
ncbi:MAG TPA: hypothetical protein VD994_20925, partial [Prosthecobacter sp.]|nr:hypothetical protein [Prosthecobacter sp.]